MAVKTFEEMGIRWDLKENTLPLEMVFSQSKIQKLLSPGVPFHYGEKRQLVATFKEKKLKKYFKIENVERFAEFWEIPVIKYLPEDYIKMIRLDYLMFSKSVIGVLKPIEKEKRTEVFSSPHWEKMIKEVMPEYFLKRVFHPDKANEELFDHLQNKTLVWKKKMKHNPYLTDIEENIFQMLLKEVQK